MRKVLCGAVVAMLAGACWVLAQNTATNRISSPYGISTPPQVKRTAVENPSTTMIIDGKQSLVAPVTQLELPEIPAPPRKHTPGDFDLSIPEAPPAPPLVLPELDHAKIAEPMVSPIAPESIDLKIPEPTISPKLPDPGNIKEPEPPTLRLPEAVEGPILPVNLQTPLPPMVSEGQPIPMPKSTTDRLPPGLPVPVPPVKIDPLPPGPPPTRLVDKPVLSSNIPEAPITPQPLPIPIMPVPPGKEPIRSSTKSALPSIPPLPPVPGVGYDPSGRAKVAPPVEYIAEPNVITPNDPVPNNPPPYVVDDPNTWTGRTDYPIEMNSRSIGPRMWASADYLLWFMKPQCSPALIVSVAGAQPGDAQFRGSQISDIYPSNFDYNPINGVRGTFGLWLNASQTIGLEASYFWFDQASVQDSFVSRPGNVVGRPFIDGTDGQSTLFSLSPVEGINGKAIVSSSVQIQGGDANLLLNSFRFGSGFNVIAGFRYFDMIERLNVAMSMQDTLSDFAAFGNDEFRTHNQFFGGQVGLRWTYEGPRLFASLTGKFAFGAMEQSVHISGQTTLLSANQSISASGNLLALPTNIGSYSRTRTTFIPELNATIGYRFTSWASAFVGYNFLYVNNLVRPGKQIDTTINPENFPFSNGSPTAFRPAFQFRDENFWLQGVNVGLSFRY